MAEKAVPGEGILVAEHHLHHRLILGVRMVVHADDSQIPGTNLMDVDTSIAAVHKIARFQIHTCLP